MSKFSEDWKPRLVGELIEFQGGSQPDKSVFSNSCRPGFVRLIQIRDYKTDRFEVFVPRILARRFCEETDIMIGRYGPPVFQILRGLAGAYNVALIKAKPQSEINGEFAYYFLKQHSLFEFIDNLSRRTSGQTGVDLVALRGYPIALPPPSEQKAIATALSDVDALLGVLDRMIAKKRDLKQATMQQLLTGQTRLPGFKGDWEEKHLGKMGDTYGGLTGKSKADFGDGTASYITFMNVMSNVIIDCSDFELVKVGPAESQNRVNKGDLLFNGSSETPEEVAMCAMMAQSVPDLYLNSFCFGFRFYPDIDVDGLFMAYYLRSREGRELMKSLAQGSTRYNLSKKAFLESRLAIPDGKEQTAIAEVLSDMDAEIAALERRRDKTRDLKQGMMQGLLTGKTRLMKPEPFDD